MKQNSLRYYISGTDFKASGPERSTVITLNEEVAGSIPVHRASGA